MLAVETSRWEYNLEKKTWKESQTQQIIESLSHTEMKKSFIAIIL